MTGFVEMVGWLTLGIATSFAIAGVFWIVNSIQDLQKRLEQHKNYVHERLNHAWNRIMELEEKVNK